MCVCCPSSTEGGTNYQVSAKQKKRAPTKTKIDTKKYYQVKSLKKDTSARTVQSRKIGI